MARRLYGAPGVSCKSARHSGTRPARALGAGLARKRGAKRSGFNGTPCSFVTNAPRSGDRIRRAGNSMAVSASSGPLWRMARSRSTRSCRSVDLSRRSCFASKRCNSSAEAADPASAAARRVSARLLTRRSIAPQSSKVDSAQGSAPLDGRRKVKARRVVPAARAATGNLVGARDW